MKVFFIDHYKKLITLHLDPYSDTHLSEQLDLDLYPNPQSPERLDLHSCVNATKVHLKKNSKGFKRFLHTVLSNVLS
jgi:hypothetical protein